MPLSWAAASPAAISAPISTARRDRQLPGEEPFPQGLALQELRHQVGRAVVGAHVVHDEDARVIEGAGGPRLLLEAQEALLVARERGGQDLDHHVAPEAGVARPVDLAHPADGQGCRDLVGPEALALGQASRGRGLGAHSTLLVLPRPGCVASR